MGCQLNHRAQCWRNYSSAPILEYMPQAPTWKFKRTFKANAFDSRSSQLAGGRIREAVAEIQRVAAKDPILAGESVGAIS